jgi:hypothetical protein
VQFNDAAAQGRALMAAAEAHLDALEHSAFAAEAAVAEDGVPVFCYVPGSAGDAMACACAAVALACTALHNARCAAYGAENGALSAQDLQADYGEAMVLASLAFKEASAYACARTCAARAMEVCGGLIKAQLKTRSVVYGGMSPRGVAHDVTHDYIMRNARRVKHYCSCQLLHVSAAATFAHACLQLDCNEPADAVQQFDCCALLFLFLAQPSLHTACLLRTVECKGAMHPRVIVMRGIALLQSAASDSV